MTASDVREQRKIAEEIINYEPPYKLDQLPEAQALSEPLPWPKKKGRSLAPVPMPFPKGKPVSAKVSQNSANSGSLPNADVLVITWTVAEGFALADVLTPGFRDVRPKMGGGTSKEDSSKPWYYYRPSNFKNDYLSKCRKGSNAYKTNRLGTYFMTRVFNENQKRNVKVLCFKSELHLNRDWIKSNVSYRTIPVADLFVQLIDEVKPKIIITVGTAGATLDSTRLGDVMVTRSAKFRLSKAFAKAPFHEKQYTCKTINMLSSSNLRETVKMLDAYKDYLDPKMVKRTPVIWCDGGSKSYKRFFPILTTDGFEFGTSKGKYENYLANNGCGVEMGDAVLGMVADYLGNPTEEVPWEFARPESLESAKKTVPHWIVIRNASDPQIDANLDKKQQIKEAVFYYKKYGYFTSVNSAIAVWAAIRHLHY